MDQTAVMAAMAAAAATVEVTSAPTQAEMEVNQVITLVGQVIGVTLLLDKVLLLDVILRAAMVDMITRMATLKFITVTVAIFRT